MSEPEKYVVICPTPEGGHIEHAFDLASSLADLTGRSQTLLSRPGARRYLATSDSGAVDVVEAIPKLPRPSRNKYVQYCSFSMALVREHLNIIVALWRLGPRVVLIIEEPRYPFPSLFRLVGRASRVVAFVHNAVDHNPDQVTAKDKIRARIAAAFYRSADALAVHGLRQAETVRTTFSRPTRSFVLPGSSRVSVPHEDADGSRSAPFSFVCLGELRPNKGIEIAIEAAKHAEVHLEVVGRSIDEEYTMTLLEMAAKAPTVDVHVQFLAPGMFQSYIENAAALVLPYTHFEAQSGVVARAMSSNTHVVISDLPALIEQVGNYDNASFVSSGSVESLASVLRNLSKNPPHQAKAQQDGGSGEADEWSRIASGISSGW